MDISILTCPQCNAMVLSDAARCHVCDHVFDEAQDEQHETPMLPTDHAVAEDLGTCAECGETFRRGLVRCWNCGAFTRDDIKEAYERMAADPERYAQPAISDANEEYSGLAPEATTRTGPWTTTAHSSYFDQHDQESDGQAEFDATDEDFSFELADSVQLTDAEGSADDDASEGYTLSIPLADDAEPAMAIPALAAESDETADEKPIEIPAIPGVEGHAASNGTAGTAGTAERPPHEESDVSHSDATGGDVLLEIARREEADISQNRRKFSDKLLGSFVVYCPMGCRVRVQERHRGKAGKCPKCHSVFFVPKTPPKKTKAAAIESEGAEPAAPAIEKWRGYQADAHLHNVVPQKLRIKADSLLNDFAMVDLAVSEDGLLLATLVTAPGFMGANLKKKPALRTALQEHLKTVGSVDGAPAATVRLIAPAALKQLAIVQPSPADVESLFGNIPVFGAGRIAIRLPREGDDGTTQYLSFTLSEFRSFSAALETACGMTGFGSDTEVPLTETYNTVPCHYSEEPVRELLGLDYYQKDPNMTLQVAGWRCSGCGLVVSEDSRKKEKIGGLNGKSIASAKCPKCKAKFGKNPLYELAPEPTSANPEAAPAAAE